MKFNRKKLLLVKMSELVQNLFNSYFKIKSKILTTQFHQILEKPKFKYI